MDTNSTVLWFRNDLRVDDNPALNFALEQGCTQAYFLSTKQQWQQHLVAPIKIDFINRHLALLKEQLSTIGIELTIVETNTFQGQVDFIKQQLVTGALTTLVVNSELELNEQKRDAEIKRLLLDNNAEMVSFESDTILPKGAVLNKQGRMFHVFTPFKKAWLQHVTFGVLPTINSISLRKYGHTVKSGELSDKWPLANDYLTDVLPNFLKNKVPDYQEYRDFPAIKATSGLSPYLAIGAISAKRVLQELLNCYPNICAETGSQEFSWLNELIWREFYRNLLFHYPALIKGTSFNSKYNALLWPERAQQFTLWTQGKTGYPIIDAAMKQLTQTGWMHNRLRMVTASFLTKNLLVNWRLGEAFFMQHLIDGDFAANNGGWQWSAGTGCDAQPYFRVFNPVTQSKKFDPDGSFIKKYLPELSKVPTKHIHEPSKFLQENGLEHIYPKPIVDLKESRLQAIQFYGFK